MSEIPDHHIVITVHRKHDMGQRKLSMVTRSDGDYRVVLSFPHEMMDALIGGYEAQKRLFPTTKDFQVLIEGDVESI